MNLFLLGFMGSGKTTIGRLIAEKLNMNFVDLDLVIESEQGITISEIFANKGEAAFRELERSTLENVMVTDNQIVSVGGGLPCFFDNIEKMNAAGLTIYLKMTPQSLSERLWNLPHAARLSRPLLANKTKSELKEFIESTLLKRELFYNKSKLLVSNDEQDAEIAAGRIITAIQYYRK
jgi:shikimate kinase